MLIFGTRNVKREYIHAKREIGNLVNMINGAQNSEMSKPLYFIYSLLTSIYSKSQEIELHFNNVLLGVKFVLLSLSKVVIYRTN